MTSAPDGKVLLITGATGKQGGSAIDALLASPRASEFSILGVTRSTDSPSAQKLAAKSPLIKLIQGDFADVPAMFRAASDAAAGRPVWGVFSVQVPSGKGQSPETEERYGKTMVDEARRQGVAQFVYASVDRGGEPRSWDNPTDIPHFASKHNIELHLRASTRGTAMGWTILRPVAFMDNFAPGFGTKVFGAALQARLGEKPLQFVAVRDIGRAAARAFLEPDAYRGKAVGLAGAELTFRQLSDAFEQATGDPLRPTFGFLGSAFLWAVPEMAKMMSWFAVSA